jgi:hypothetical protein
MRVRNFLLNVGWLEIWLQVRLGRHEHVPMRRYRPIARRRLGRARDLLMHQLADTFSPDQSP